MDFSKNTKMLFMIAGAILLVGIVYALPILLNALAPQVCTAEGQCEHELFANEIVTYMPLLFLAGIIIGAVSYYFLSERMQPAPAQFDRSAAYKLLDEDERKVFAKIVEGGGKALQTEISYIEGMGKVKAHRIVERLADKGLIEKEGFGKTNVVRLSKDLRELFTK